MIDFGITLGSLISGFTVMMVTTKGLRGHSARINIGQLGIYVLGTTAGLITFLAIYCGFRYLLEI